MHISPVNGIGYRDGRTRKLCKRRFIFNVLSRFNHFHVLIQLALHLLFLLLMLFTFSVAMCISRLTSFFITQFSIGWKSWIEIGRYPSLWAVHSLIHRFVPSKWIWMAIKTAQESPSKPNEPLIEISDEKSLKVRSTFMNDLNELWCFDVFLSPKCKKRCQIILITSKDAVY